MTKTKEERQKVVMPLGIRHKLTAALCMLLVASIMMVSSTYAWFTLSTAPEVKGITTNVGSNGNLEIMLLDSASKQSGEPDLGVVSQVGDSSAAQGTLKSNVTWGNIVDLTHENYGLSQITLLPARANIMVGGDGGNIVGTIPLYGPKYGVDGRVSEITKGVTLGTYTGTQFETVTEPNQVAAGVVALGVSGGLSPLVSAFQNARANATGYAGDALRATRNSMSANGQNLANMMIALATGTADLKGYLPGLRSMVGSMGTARDNLGNAIKQAALAGVLSEKPDLTDTQVATLVAAVNAATVGDLSTALGGAIPAGLNDVIALYNTIDGQISSADTKLTTLEGQATVSSNALQAALTDLVDPNKVTVCNLHLRDGKDAIMQAAVDAILAGSGIPIVLDSDSGVYDNMAQAVGHFTVNTTVHVDYNSMSADVSATISTQSYPNKITSYTGTLTAPTPADGGSNKEVLTDIYGYQLDFGFRTNAADSYLKLQIDAAQRVYTDSTATLTQGSGSYFEFESDKLVKDELLALIHTARVLFVEGSGEQKLLAVAAADIEVDAATGALSVDEGTPEAPGKATFTPKDATKPEGVGSWKIPLAMFTYTADTAADGGPNLLTLGAKKVLGEDADQKADAVENICRLDQNVAKKISVITYFDGDQIDNSMVANDAKSLTGKLNLQFSSSASLKAMENSGLRNGGTPNNDTPIEYTEYTGITSKEVDFNEKTYTVALNPGYKVYKGSDDNYYYKADSSETYTRVNIDDYTALRNAGAFTLTEKTATP